MSTRADSGDSSGYRDGPLTLGPQAQESGQLRAGFDADVIAVSADPLADVKVLASPQSVTHVWRSGRLMKKPVPGQPGLRSIRQRL